MQQLDDTKKRKRSSEFQERKQRNKVVSGKTIKTGINSFCKDGLLLRQIESLVHNTSQIAFESAKLVQLHTLRCLEEGHSLPNMNASFYYRAACLVSVTGDKHEPNAVPKDPLLSTTFFDLYLKQRPKDLAFPSRSYITQAMNYAGQELLVNAKNNVATNFEKRHLYGSLPKVVETSYPGEMCCQIESGFDPMC
jgi:hypothetical protein